MITLVPVPVSALVPEKNDMIVVRGAAAAATGGVKAAYSFGPLRGHAPVASMLVSIPARVEFKV